MRALTVQLQVIYALLLRETKTRFGENQLGYLWALIEPLLWIGVFTTMYYMLGREGPPGMHLVPFLVTGIIPYLLFRETSSRTASAIDANKGLLYYPQVRPLDLVLSRALLEWTTMLVVFALLMGAFALFQGRLRVDHALRVVLGLLLASAMGVGLGLVFCGLSVFTSAAQRLQGPLLRPLIWTSGVFFVVDSLPTRARQFLLYNPLLHAVELVRGGWFPTHESRYVSVTYPAFWAICLLFFGLSLERVARRRLQLT
jgi:capsular polysaccharide transport system permease protein